jgi:DNA-binding transcriptional MerR regulator
MSPVSDSDETLRAFSAEHVVKLTGLSKSQLRYWDQTGFFQPEYASENRRSPFSRVYSFQNVAGLRTLGILRRAHKIPLQQLRKVADELSKYRNAPWSQIKLYVFGRQVTFSEPETGRQREVVSGQYVLVKLESIIHDLKVEASKLKERSPEQVGMVVRNRFIAHNAWVIAGTRIPTRAIQRFHEAGYSAKAIVREYPMLKEADVAAALGHEEKIARRA